MNQEDEFTEPSPVHLNRFISFEGGARTTEEKSPVSEQALSPECMAQCIHSKTLQFFWGIERVMRIELTSPAWEAGVIAIIRHPQRV